MKISINDHLNYMMPILALAFLYFFFGKVSLLFLHGNQIVNIGVFASEGIALAFILFFGKRVWLGVFIGQFFLAFGNGIPLLASLGISVVNSLVALMGYALFHRFDLNKRLLVFRDIIGLVLIMVIIEMFSAGVSNVILVSSHSISASSYFETAFSWWFGNVMGQMLITPALLLLLIHFKTLHIVEYFVYAVVYGVYIYLLEVMIPVTNLLLLLSLSIPVVVFVVSQKGFVYGAMLSVVVAFVSAYAVYLGLGAFYLHGTIENVVDYNLFVLAHISTVHVTGILFEERKSNEKRLHRAIADEVKKNREQQIFLLEQSRLAQMGEMISMIAHQWRQPLNNLSLVNQVLLAKYQIGQLDDDALEQFKEHSHRQIALMSSTIDDFRNYFRSEAEAKRYCVNEVLDDIFSMVEGSYIKDGIEIQLKHTDNCHSHGYPNEFGQAILNIVNNAKDVLLERQIEEKKITIEIECRGDVVISIEDNAGGVDEAIMDKIFDPYFSTKDEKNGTGLGLYMSKMIIQEKLEGKILLDNSKKGAIFRIIIKGVSNAA